MQLTIPQCLYSQLIQEAKHHFPQECCGYLLGSTQGQNNLLQSYIPMPNTHKTPQTHFAFDPLDQLQAFGILKQKRLQIIGVFHSHPNSPPIPSQEDLRFSFFVTQSFLIISLKNGITFASYRINAHKAKKEKIEILS
ncbi:M67 family metallopeptidase [Helicobacter kayseriensis]|uniref:M67 family metallopeptidase n=1 Tax=Helicobacter kayseriensis TaxID=2905877 RepID=UPI001E4168CC|nr:M67 family metallopeptidase [Helicobacter kayseriensis]MCE3047079.1 M67 family metallopeptidase [Helicobacter kayseriensis]MCE3048261.1 M67 family metallopeptidase [Helicobacter kayseriensis]